MGPSIYKPHNLTEAEAAELQRAFERRWGPGHQAAFSVKGLAVMAGVLFVVWVALLVSALSAGGAAH